MSSSANTEINAYMGATVNAPILTGNRGPINIIYKTAGNGIITVDMHFKTQHLISSQLIA